LDERNVLPQHNPRGIITTRKDIEVDRIRYGISQALVTTQNSLEIRKVPIKAPKRKKNLAITFSSARIPLSISWYHSVLCHPMLRVADGGWNQKSLVTAHREGAFLAQTKSSFSVI
jgi:hypothetical protein